MTVADKQKEESLPEKEVTGRVAVRNFGGEIVDQIDLLSSLKKKANLKLVSQAVLIERTRSRIRRAHTKMRGEMRGGGAKPWRQKGTGRARHGSRRSPIWVGGAVTFGPRALKKRNPVLPAKMKRRSLAAAIGRLIGSDRVEVIRFGANFPRKTKEAVKVTGGRRGLVIAISKEKADLARVFRNLKGVRVRFADELTVSDVINAKQIWVDEEAVSVLMKRFGDALGKNTKD